MLKKFRKKRQSDIEFVREDVNVEELNIDEIHVEELKTEAENMEESTIRQHEQHFSDERLWKKLHKSAKKAGSSVIYAVLILYFTLQKPEIPLKVKATIAGALGYFILPIDLIPDVALGVGYIDDLGVITAALFQVAIHIDEGIKKQAKDKMKDWFGENIDTSEIDEKIKI
ncbi:YkvA family protein [Ornithinibacillus salinisoli]|uniref:YkvA family protein n=1 Tax=Ornithinibacillus salinisoli TaxID=1848459 RepID=A0ABW4W202_9BACI